MKPWKPFVFGGAFGIAIWFLADFGWRHAGTGNFLAMLPVIIAQPARLIVPTNWGFLDLVLRPAVLMLLYALVAWVAAAVVRFATRNRRAFIPLAVVLVLCYAATWGWGRSMVREEIKRQRAADYPRLQARYPEDVSKKPELQVYYCVPILPFVVACEFDYIYGPLMGWGEGNLWLWRLTDVTAFCGYAYWVH